jgi:hypothetical protein
VLRRLHAIDATRLRQTRSGVVFFSIPGRFAGRRERRLALVDVLRRRAHEGLSQSLRRGQRGVRRDRISSVGWRCPRHVPLRRRARVTRRAPTPGRHLRHVRRFDCGCRNDSELARDLYDDSALSNNLKCFESTPWECLKRLYREGACYDSERWMDIARWFANDAAIQNMTFLEAFERSGRALAITVCATGKKAPPVLLTHKTSPHVVIISAIVATSAVPRLLPPQILLEKDPSTGELRPQAGSELYIDGSIAHDIPAAALREAFNARFVVASQVNPHMQPMFYHAHGDAGEPNRWGSVGEASWRGGYALAALELFLRKDMAAKLEFLRDVDATPGWSGRVFTQSPKGCVTITPRLRWSDGFRLFSNPTPASLRSDCREGRVATYQKLAMLRTRVHVERALQDACAQLHVDRSADRTGGSLAWATPQTLADFPDVRDTAYDSGADFADDGL